MPRSCSDARRAAGFAHHDAAGMRPRGLGPLASDAVVADHRCREGDELLGVARIGDDLLVAGHRCREDRLAEGEAGRADRLAAKDGAVLEEQEAGHPSYTALPAATVIRTFPVTG